MERLDYVEEIRSSVISKDTLGFHHILQELKKIDSFEGSLMLAQGFDASNSLSYSRFVYLALCENPEWGTVSRKGVYINTFGRIIIFPSGVVTARVIDGDIQTILCENGTEYLIDEEGNKLSEVYHQDAKSYTNPC